MCPVYGAARENYNGDVGAMGMRPTDMKIFYLREKIRPIWEGLYTRSPVDINNGISGGYWLPPTGILEMKTSFTLSAWKPNHNN